MTAETFVALVALALHDDGAGTLLDFDRLLREAEAVRHTAAFEGVHRDALARELVRRLAEVRERGNRLPRLATR